MIKFKRKMAMLKKRMSIKSDMSGTFTAQLMHKVSFNTSMQ